MRRTVQGMTGRGETPDGADDPGVQAVAAQALDLIADGTKVGLGSGRAASAFIAKLGERVRQGLRIVGVPTSGATARQARDLGIPLIDLGEDVELDVTVDGADEVAPSLDLVKGWGGALVRERIVASASRRQVILVGCEKLVRALGLLPSVRVDPEGSRPLLTENGNLTLDCAINEPLQDDGHTARVLVGYPDGRVEVLGRRGL